MMLVSASTVLAAASTDELSMSPQARANFNAIPQELQTHILADEELSAAATYAYMDLDTASDALKDDILAARDSIIYSEGWTVDGNGYIELPDGTVEVLPKFSDLFPGWDLPVCTSSSECEEDISPIEPAYTPNFQDVYIDNYTIVKYNPSVATPRMARVRANTTETLVVSATRLTCSTCNIGISQNGTTIGWKPNITAGKFFHIYPKEGLYYDIRVSTYNNSGKGDFHIVH